MNIFTYLLNFLLIYIFFGFMTSDDVVFQDGKDRF